MKRILSLICLVLLFTCLIPQSIFAAPHEDPVESKIVYNSLSLLFYYSDSLDPVLNLDPASTESGLSKMPFANIPPSLDQPTKDFAVSGIAFSASLSELFTIWQQENQLISEYRLDEADESGKQIAARLPQARNQLAQLKLSVQQTGDYLKIGTLEASNPLFQSYQGVMEKIQRLEDMLDLLSRPLLDIDKISAILQSSNPGLLEQILTSGNIDLLKAALKPTSLTLQTDPLSAFVGDELNFSGQLTSPGSLLAERNIDLLIDNSVALSVKTDSQGRFEGKLQVPYKYQPELSIQAVYYPQGADSGVYLGSASPLIKLKVLYYEASLVLGIEGPAYPGKEALLKGKYDYGRSPVPLERQAGLYLDDALIMNLSSGVNFSQKINLDSSLTPGKHTILVIASASGRYAGVSGSCVLDLVQAAVTLDLNLPGLAWIPGNIAAGGQLHSDLGTLNNAGVEMVINGKTNRFNSDRNGIFSQQIPVSWGLNLLGTQKIDIRVQPAEPWNAPLSLSRNVFMINYLNCGLLLIALLVLSVYFSRRLKKRIPAVLKEKRAPEIVVSLPDVREEITPDISILQNEKKSSESGETVFGGYRLVLKLIQSLTQVFIKPQQTFREYALENSPKLGPLGKYFLDFTYLIEKFLYCSRKPANEDLEKSRQLAEVIQKEANHEKL
jgi:hypothetical protein